MYFTCFSTLLILSCFVQHGQCTTNCTADQLGAVVPASACDISKCKSVTIDQLNKIKNSEVKASNWNSARAVLVGSCPLTYTFDAKDNPSFKMTLDITIKYGSSCNEVTHYPLTFTSSAEADGGYKIFATKDADVEWDLCFPYLEGSDFIYRRCRTNPAPPAGKGYATIYVYESEAPTDKAKLNAAADSLGVKWDKKTVDCL